MDISIENLTKKYGHQLALKDVSLKINQGDVVGLLGPNGAGKSTLMKCLTGNLTPTSGFITLGNLNIEKDALEIKKSLGYLPENNPLYTEMYVKEYLTFVTKIRGLDSSKIEEVIQRVGLTLEQSKKIKALSKGYKQRVGLAQAIIHEPEVLILDEPTNGLDPNQIIEIRELIRTVGKNKTVILSTHIMQEVAALCTRVILLDKGQVLADKPIDMFQGDFNSLEEAFYDLTTK